MTNREKYAKKILDIACAGSPISVKKGVRVSVKQCAMSVI